MNLDAILFKRIGYAQVLFSIKKRRQYLLKSSNYPAVPIFFLEEFANISRIFSLMIFKKVFV
jgi:hypothetical protein